MVPNSLDEKVLTQVFDTYWPSFEAKYKEAAKLQPMDPKPQSRSDQDILAELLELARALNHRLSRLEENIQSGSSQVGQGHLTFSPEATTPLVSNKDSMMSLREIQRLVVFLAGAGVTEPEITEKLVARGATLGLLRIALNDARKQGLLKRLETD